MIRLLVIYMLMVATPTTLCECTPKYVGGSFNNAAELEERIDQFYMDPTFEQIDRDAFRYAFVGYDRMKENVNDSTLILIDFSLSANQKRFYVIDTRNKQLLFSRLCSHGKNTGEEYATEFSNEEGSLMSSMGFYLTAETYQGENGLSLRLDGLEEGINDNARSRDVVIHGASYCSEEFIEDNGRLGRSFGCPSLPFEDYEVVIERIKEGACLFIYYPDKDYLKSSRYLN